MKEFIVSFSSKIVGSHDYVYVVAKNADEALKIGKPMLNTRKLIPDFLNGYGRFHVCEVN